MAKYRFCEKLVPYIWFIPYLVILNYTYRFFKEQKGFPTPAFYETSSVINTVNTTSVDMSTYPLLQDAGKACHNPNVPLSDSFFIVDRKNVSTSFLCKLNMTAYCGSIEPSEVVDRYWVVCPAYASFQTFIQYRYILHENYKGYIESFGLVFSTIEAIRKDRNQEYLLTKPGNEPYDIQIEFWDDMYIRENFLNVAARKIPNWDYFAWIDTHQIFENVYWWEESIVQAEKYASVQLFKFFQNFDINNVTDSTSQAALRLSQVLTSFDFGGPRVLGNAYVIRKELYDKIDIIYDECVASCCDCAWILASVERDFHFSGFASLFGYTNQMHPWINHTRSVFNASRITTRGTLYHLYHEHNFNYLPMLFAMNETDFVFKRDLVRDENRTLRIQNEKIKKYFEKDTFWMNFNYYVKENHIDFYTHAFGSIVVSLALAYFIQRFAKRRSPEISQENSTIIS